jgi:chemotaxis protein methyltransferase CheR
MKRLELTDDEFTVLAALLDATAGLVFDESRRDSLTFCVAERMEATGTPDASSYITLLASSEGARERQFLLDEVTIPETHFFRNPPQVRALRRYVLPELLRQASATKRLRVWSAGCSTGEEAYTVAILIRELLGSTVDWDIKVFATDVSNRALSAARQAHYAERAFVMTEPLDLARWFVMDTTTASWVVRDEVRQLVEFRHHNLVTEPLPFEPGEVDLTLCRNVTIYFDRDTTRGLMRRLHSGLRDGGYLFLGHAETLWQISDDFALVSLGDAFVYRRLDDEPAGEERRWVLPDRRTEDDLRPTRANRRRGAADRRDRAGAATSGLPRPPVTAEPVVRAGAAEPAVRAGSATSSPGVVEQIDAADLVDEHELLEPLDPLDAVRSALETGRYDEAADVAAEVAAATPLRADAHYLHGVALTNLGRDGEGLVVLRKAVYLDPEHGLAHFMLAGALERLGEPIAASRSYLAAAGSLQRRPVDGGAAELGGRSATEFAELCVTLAQRTDPSTRNSGGSR